MMKQILSAILFIILLYFAYKVSKRRSSNIPEHKDTRRPPIKLKPVTPVRNEKIICVANVSEENIKQVALQFCNMYNHDVYKAILKITPITKDSFAITFPYDIEFADFLILVNYLYYPFDIEYSPKISGWIPLTDEIPDEQGSWGMFYVPSDDKEYDIVCMLTENNHSYKFNIGSDKGVSHIADTVYEQPPLSTTDLEERRSFIID